MSKKKIEYELVSKELKVVPYGISIRLTDDEAENNKRKGALSKIMSELLHELRIENKDLADRVYGFTARLYCSSDENEGPLCNLECKITGDFTKEEVEEFYAEAAAAEFRKPPYH